MNRFLGAVAGAFVLVLALVVSVAGPAAAHSTRVWTLSGVTFDDGGTLTGTVTMADDGTMLSADVTTSGGHEEWYGAKHYVVSTSSGLGYSNRPAGAGWDFNLNAGQYLHFPVPDTSGAQVGDSRAVPSGGYECLNCTPWRNIVAGSIVAGAVTDLDPPEVTSSVDPVHPDGDNGWYVGEPTVSFDVNDPDTAISSATGCDPTTVTEDTTGTTLTCEATSGGGTATQSVTIQRDATPPTITKAWLSSKRVLLNAKVRARATATDATSGVASVSCDPNPVFSSAAGLAATWCTATDVAGNQTQQTVSYTVRYAMTAPVVSGAWRTHSKVTVSTKLEDAHGVPLKASLAKALGCRVKVALTGAQSHRACLKYNPRTHAFSATWRLGSHVGRTHVKTSVSYQFTSVVTSRTKRVSIKRA